MPSPKVYKNIPVTELKDMYLQFTLPPKKIKIAVWRKLNEPEENRER